MIRWLWAALLAFSTTAVAAEPQRSVLTDQWWIEGAAAISPDSGIFHAEDSAVGDRKDVSIRYQPGVLGVVANIHSNWISAEVDQEGYRLHNTVYGLGFTVKLTPFGESGGFWGGSHLVAHALLQRGRSDYHVFNGPTGGTKSEVAADIVHAGGFEVGVDGFFPVYYGLWFLGGFGFENNGFAYDVSTDPNGDGAVNMRRSFIYLRAGLAFSI